MNALLRVVQVTYHRHVVTFNVTQDGRRQLAGLLMFINNVHSLGLELTQGLLLSEGFYWDMNDETRAWSKRFFERMKKMPDMSQAGSYSATRHYLAVQARERMRPAQ